MPAYIEAEDIKEHLMECADRLSDLGFDGMEDTLNSNGPVGKAYRWLRGEDELEILAKYLKSVAAAFKAKNDAQPGVFAVQQAMMALDLTWNCMKECCQLPEAQKSAPEPRSVMQLQAPGVPTADRAAGAMGHPRANPHGVRSGPRLLGPAVPAMRQR